jgi:hypothetical protein
VENIAEFTAEFFVEKLREKNNLITTRPLAHQPGAKHFLILVFYYVFLTNLKKN